MNRLRPRAALVAAATTLCIAGPLLAQTAPAKAPIKATVKAPAKAAAKSAPAAQAAAAEKLGSFGNAGGTGKLLTRDELRACFKERDELAARRVQLDAEQKRNEAERTELLAAGETLKTELAALDRSSGDAVDAYNLRAKKRDEAVDGYNTRQRKLVADAEKLTDTQSLWKSECGDRRYREDDEIAIRRSP
jgi:hypothetical protein